MFKIKSFKVELKHLVTAVSALGMLAGFVISICSKKKAAACVTFFASFAAFLAGVGMEAGEAFFRELVKGWRRDGLEIEVETDPENEETEETTEEDETAPAVDEQ